MLQHNSFTIDFKYVATYFRVVMTAFFKIFFKFFRDKKLYGRDLESSFQPVVLTNLRYDIDLLVAT